jgi:hypothetical protein
VGHYRLRHSPGAEKFSLILKEAVAGAQKMGFEVCGIVCDQEASQWRCIQLMGANSNHPLVKLDIDGQINEISAFIDTPHCLKNMRNALMKCIIEFNDDDIRKSANWSDICAVAEAELGKADQLRLVPKLTEAHINLPLGKK